MIICNIIELTFNCNKSIFKIFFFMSIEQTLLNFLMCSSLSKWNLFTIYEQILHK